MAFALSLWAGRRRCTMTKQRTGSGQIQIWESVTMKMTRCLLMALVFVMSAGCAGLVLFGAGAAAGLAGYKYHEGALSVTYEAPYMKTWDATLAALKDMKLVIKTSKHDLTQGKIEAKRADGSQVNVDLEYKSAKQTQVTIRVGNKDASEAIEKKITEVLFKD
jgi:preprotein translocase subunit SecF